MRGKKSAVKNREILHFSAFLGTQSAVKNREILRFLGFWETQSAVKNREILHFSAFLGTQSAFSRVAFKTATFYDLFTTYIRVTGAALKMT